MSTDLRVGIEKLVARLRSRARHIRHAHSTNPLIAQRFEMKRNADALDALLRASGDGFQPIETAPKDGTPILLLYAGDGVIQGQWETKHWIRDGGEWTPIKLSSHGCGCCGSDDDDPTHWMPIPAPPAAQHATQAQEPARHDD